MYFEAELRDRKYKVDVTEHDYDVNPDGGSLRNRGILRRFLRAP